MPEEKKKKALRILDPDMGQIAIQPSRLTNEELWTMDYVFFPSKMRDYQYDLFIECIQSSKAEIFCQQTDLEKVAKEGFSTHRVQGLDSFQSVELKGGSVEFFPTDDTVTETGIIGRFFQRRRPKTFHVLIRPSHKMDPILYLASPKISPLDLQYFLFKNPLIIGNPLYPMGVWHDLEKRHGVDIETAEYNKVFSSRVSQEWERKQKGQETYQDKISELGYF